MNSRRQKILLMMRITSDLVMVSLAWVVAYYVRFHSGIAVADRGVPPAAMYLKLIPFIAVIWLAVLSAAGFYRRTGRHRSAFIEAIDILQSCVLATFAFIAFTYFYEEYRYSRLTLVIFALLHPGMIIAGRSVIRKGLRYFRRHSDPRSIIIIGSGEIFLQAVALSDLTDVTTRPVVTGILVGTPEQIAMSQKFCDARRIATMPPPANWAKFFGERTTQMVMLALPHGAYPFLESHLEEIVNQVPDVRLVPDLMRYTKFAAGIEILRGVPVISVHESPLVGMGSVFKRVLDVFGAVVGVILFAPVMIVAAAVIKLTSPGPIFYRQERMGIDGKTFHILKFRTMPVNAESKTGAVWAKPNDNRPTKFGSWLRKSSMDEIPQFFNVLMGDMSLVGPRPERPIFVQDFRTKIPGYMLRHKVKAGMTGWAQINGWRGDTSLEKRIECDLFYIQNWSMWLDLRILTLTLVRGFFNRNAY